MLRDPRDILASYTRAWSGGKVEADFFIKTGALVRYYFDKVFYDAFWQTHPSMLITYEEMVVDPNRSAEGICSFLDLDFVTDMLSFHDSERARNLSFRQPHQKLTRAIDASSIGKYHDVFNAEQLALIEELFHQPMTDLGYATTTGASERIRRHRWLRQARKRLEYLRAGR